MMTPDLAIGQLVNDPAQKQRFLPIAVRLAGAGSGTGPKVLVAALDSEWLMKHLEAARVEHPTAMSRAALIIADRDGTIVGRVPDSADGSGRAGAGLAAPADQPR